MTRTLMVTVVALFALGSIATQGASAATDTFETGSEPALVTGEADPTPGAGTQSFKIAGAEPVTCATLHLTGTQAEKSSALELIPQYTSFPQYTVCMFGTLAATVENFGATELTKDGTAGACKFVFHGQTGSNSATGGVEDGGLDIKCEKGKSILIGIYATSTTSHVFAESPICSITIGERHGEFVVNQGLKGVRYTNVQTAGKPKEITAEAKVHKIKYVAEGEFCFLAGIEVGTHENLIYEGKATIRAFKDLNLGTETGEQVNAGFSSK